MKRRTFLFSLVGAMGLSAAGKGFGQELYLIDAHSQLADGVDPALVVSFMDKAGVRHMILSARESRTPADILGLAKQHKDRITAAVRTKGRGANELQGQLAMPGFSAMAEFLMYHAAKGKRAPEWIHIPDSPEAIQCLNAVIERGWPFVAHIEFAAAGSRRALFRDKFEAMARENRQVPFVLIHMAQLEVAEARRLIETHPNVNFMTSHSNPVSKANGGNQPWINMFSGNRLAPAWLELIAARPDRFILAFDNVWPEHWGNFFIDQAALWRKALADLPIEVAHMVAHGNAERLWKLPTMG